MPTCWLAAILHYAIAYGMENNSHGYTKALQWRWKFRLNNLNGSYIYRSMCQRPMGVLWLRVCMVSRFSLQVIRRRYFRVLNLIHTGRLFTPQYRWECGHSLYVYSSNKFLWRNIKPYHFQDLLSSSYLMIPLESLFHTLCTAFENHAWWHGSLAFLTE